jgi:hypothetical protein
MVFSPGVLVVPVDINKLIHRFLPMALEFVNYKAYLSGTRCARVPMCLSYMDKHVPCVCQPIF